MAGWRRQIKASSLVGRGDYAAAGAIFREIVAEDPSDGYAVFMIAMCYEQEGRLFEARPWAEASVRALPDNLYALQAAARLAIANDDHDKATDYVLRALALPEVVTEMPKAAVPRPLMWLIRALRHVPFLRRRISPAAIESLEPGSLALELQEWKEWAQGYLAWRRGHDTPEPSGPH